MKKLRKLEINPERVMKDEELVVLRGGYDVGDCPYRPCKTNDDCCTGNPVCDEPIGWPGQKYCWSPT